MSSVVSKVIVCIVRVRMCAPAFISFVCGWWGGILGLRTCTYMVRVQTLSERSRLFSIRESVLGVRLSVCRIVYLRGAADVHERATEQ